MGQCKRITQAWRGRCLSPQAVPWPCACLHQDPDSGGLHNAQHCSALLFAWEGTLRSAAHPNVQQ